MDKSNFDWAEDLTCAVTVCDTEGTILFMNRRSRDTFASHGDIIGQNLFQFHKPESQAKIRHMLATGTDNTYKVVKNGVSKLIHQTPWRIDGNIAGMVEFSTILPPDMRTIVRQTPAADK